MQHAAIAESLKLEREIELEALFKSAYVAGSYTQRIEMSLLKHL